MGASAERLAEIDRELLAFGKSEDELRAVVERARAWVASLDDLDAALAALTDEGEAAAPVEPAAAAPVEPPPSSSDIAGLSVDELFADVEPSAGAAETGGLADLFDDVHPPTGAPLDDGLGDLFDDELTGSSDASGGSELADLFDDDAPADGASGLGDLFDDEEPAATSTADAPLGAALDGDLADLFDDPPTSKDAAASESPKSAPPPLPPAERSSFSEEDEEITGSFSAADVAALEAQVASESDVELVDDQALELDEDALERDAAVDDTRPGLISRILGRK